MLIFQKFYMRTLNTTFYLIEKINERIRLVCVYICLCFLTCACVAWQILAFFKMEVPKAVEASAAIGILLLLILMSIKAKLVPFSWKICPLALLCSASLLMLLSWLWHPIGEGIPQTAAMMLAIFPGLYFVWGNRDDYETFYKALAKISVYTLLIYIMVSLELFPISVGQNVSGGRYAGITPNPNVLGMLCVTGIISALYLIMEEHRNKVGIYIVALGFFLFCMTYTASRTAMLVTLLELIAFGVYYIRHKLINGKHVLEAGIIFVITFFIVIFSAIILPYSYSQAEVETTVYSAKKAIAQTENKSEEVQEETKPSPFSRLDGKRTADITALSSGRTIVWKNYLEQLNFQGHDGEELLYIEDGYDKSEWAHNTALEIAYRCGIIPGILFLALEIYAGIYMLIWMIGKKSDSWALFSSMGVIAFSVYSVLEVIIYPFEHSIMLWFFMAIMPMFKNTRNPGGLQSQNDT